MSQQGPVMQPQQKSGIPGWLMGCGIGCGILVIAGIVGIVLLGGLGYFAFQQGMEQFKVQAVAELETEYDEYVENGVIPDEHLPLYDELRDLGINEETSFYAVLLVFSAIAVGPGDGEVTEQDVAIAQDVRDFVKENPQAGFIAMGTFVQEHPEIQQAFNEAQREFGVPSEPGAMGENGMETPPEPEVTPEEAPTEPAGAEQ